MKNSKISIATRGLVILFAAAGVCLADTHYVSPGQSIQAAIDAATNGDQIEVAPGTYNESINFSGKAVRLYNSTGPAVTIINANGAAHAVQCVSGEDANTILEGFTVIGATDSGMYNSSSSPTVTNCTFTGITSIWNGGGMCNINSSSPIVTNCTFTGNSANYSGGGMYNSYSNPTVTNCTFSGNSANYDGGGMYNFIDSDPTVTNCTFTGNTAANGGGMSNFSGSPTVTGCTFSDNTADANGGGMYNEYNSPPVTNCTFSQNTAGAYGGGMHNYNSSSPTVTDCTFSDNSAGQGGGIANENSSPTVSKCSFWDNAAGGHGGGIYNISSSPLVTNCGFWQNTAGLHGGGIMNNYSSNATVINCIFVDNDASAGGGGMAESLASATVTNSTFFSNTAGYGGGIYIWQGNSVTTNCILWGDTPDEINSNGSPTVTYCDIQGGFPGDNIALDPCFIYAAAGNLHLKRGSPCIDAGNNAAVPAGVLLDADGKLRFRDDPNTEDTGVGPAPIVDMGAFEYGLTAKFGYVDGKNVKLTQTDCGGNKVMFALTGGGFGLIDPCDCDFGQIELYETTEKSALKISTKSKTGTPVGDIICNGPMNSITAKGVDLQGDFVIYAYVYPNSKASVKIAFNTGDFLNLHSGLPIKSISAAQWLGGSLEAPSIDSLSIKGNKKRGLAGGLYIDVDVDDAIGSVKVAEGIIGSWECQSVKSIKALWTDDSEFILNQTPDPLNPKLTALGKLTVKECLEDTHILSAGNIGAVAVGGMVRSCCFAGITEGITGLPAAEAASFSSEPATIKSIMIKCMKGEEYGCENSNIAAANILSASIAYPNNDNGGVPFGITADYIKKLTIKDAEGTESLKELKKQSDVPADLDLGDAEIRLYEP